LSAEIRFSLPNLFLGSIGQHWDRPGGRQQAQRQDGRDRVWLAAPHPLDDNFQGGYKLSKASDQHLNDFAPRVALGLFFGDPSLIHIAERT
jgi:hypothetical protein